MTTTITSIDATDITPFCPGLKGRELCKSCAGLLPAGQVARVLHEPWPFDPCPHYLPELPKDAE